MSIFQVVPSGDQWSREEILAALFEESGDALFLFDVENAQILDVNPMAQKLTGFCRRELLSMTVIHLFRPDQHHGLERLRQAFRRTGHFHSQEGFYLRHRHDGVWVPVNISVTRLHTQPRVLGLLTVRDISDRKQAEEVLRESEARFRQVWECSLDGMRLTDAQGTIVAVNEAFCRMVGLNARQLEGQLLSVIHAPEHRDRVLASYRGRFAKRQFDGLVARKVHLWDGRHIWVEMSSAFLERSGTPLLLCIFRDVTERKRTEECVVKHQNELQSILDTVGAVIWECDPHTLQFHYVSQQAERMLGYPVEAWLHEPDFWRRHIHEQDRDWVVEYCRRATEELRDHTLEYRMVAADGRVVWIRDIATVVAQSGQVHKLRGLMVDISEVREKQEQLRYNEERFRLLADNAFDVVAEISEDGRHRYVSANVTQVLGYAPEELVGQLAGRWVHPEDLPRATAEFRKDAARCTYRYRHKNGQWRWLESSMRRFTTPSGEHRAVVITRDISEHVRAEQLLSTEKEVLEAVATGRPLGEVLHLLCTGAETLCSGMKASVLLLTPQGTLVHAAAPSLPEEYRRLVDGIVIGPEVGSCGTAAYWGRPVIVADTYTHPLWKDFRHLAQRFGLRACWSMPVFAVDGRVLGTFALYHEQVHEPTAEEQRIIERFGRLAGIVIERQRIYDKVLESEAKYRSLVENLEQNVFMKDRQFRFVAANQVFCKSLGCSEAEIIGKTDFDFYPAELATKYRADDERVLREGIRLEVEERNLDRGQERWVRVIKTPVRNAQGEITGLLGIFWDVTHQRNLEAQMRHMQKMEAVGQLAGGIAHDFNNLLTAIIGNLELAASQLGQAGLPEPGPCDTGTLVRAALEASQRAAALTRQLLGFARRTPLHIQPVVLRQVIEDTFALLRRTIDPRISLEMQVAEDVWPVSGDAGQLGQVLMNLCLNARDAMPAGGRLCVTAENCTLDERAAQFRPEASAGSFVRLQVSDTGSGIAPEVLPHIFEPFFTTKEPGKGTGLGLAVVYGIVRQHRGWIECQSQPGQGTTFTIYLPSAQHTTNRPAPATKPKAPQRGCETILVVDDEAMLRNLAQLILMQLGYRVLVAEDGYEALEIYGKHRDDIDLVILDLTMPKLSGRDTLQKLKELDQDARVLISSGYSSDAELLQTLDRGAVVGFVGKPYTPAQLAQAVRQALDGQPVACDAIQTSTTPEVDRVSGV
ncbi:MAG: hypothetical protein C4296_09785 [Gemmataceae bacterium]